jgi:DNA-directed RNA polymerase specialized sigma24 family protein
MSDPPSKKLKASGLEPDEADQEADSEAGDNALPPEEEQKDAPVANPVLDAERQRLHVRLDDARLRERIHRHLVRRHSLAEDVADDVTQDAFFRAFRVAEIPAESVPMFPWLRKFASYSRLRYQRDAKRTDREQPDERIEEHALEPSPENERAADVVRIANDLARKDPRHAETLQMLHARAEGLPIVAIAVEANLTEEATKKRMQRFAQLVRQRWVEASAALVAACAAVLLYLHGQIPYPSPKPTGHDPMAALPARPPPLPPDIIRNEGFKRCNEEKWEECLALLERADRADPAGDRAAVGAARNKALRALKEKALKESRERELRPR